MKLIKALQRRLLCSLPNGQEAHRSFLGIEKLQQEINSLSKSRHSAPISKADEAFAKGLIGIASSYGFSYVGKLTGGSFHFYRVDDTLHQRVRIYPDFWPHGVCMFLDIGPHSGGVQTETGIEFRENARGWEENMTPKSDIIDKLIAYLEHAQKHREYQEREQVKRYGQE